MKPKVCSSQRAQRDHGARSHVKALLSGTFATLSLLRPSQSKPFSHLSQTSIVRLSPVEALNPVRFGMHEAETNREQFDPIRFYQRPKFRSEEHTSELQSLMRISYAVFCLKKKKKYK